MTNYHISEDGNVRECIAEEGDCPVQAPNEERYHSTNKKELEAKAEEVLGEEFGKFSTLSHLSKTTESELESILANLEWASEWSEGLQKMKETFPLALGATPSSSIRNQIINMFSNNLGKGFNRSQLEAVGKKLGVTTGDAIQWANKIERVGLKLWKIGSRSKPYYGFEKLEFTDKYLTMSQDLTTASGRKRSEEQLRKYFAELSVGNFEKGHKDPRKPLSDDNLVMQPQEINRAHRNNYIFDERGLPRVPNPDVFAKHPEKFYEKEDLLLILEGVLTGLGEETVRTKLEERLSH